MTKKKGYVAPQCHVVTIENDVPMLSGSGTVSASDCIQEEDEDLSGEGTELTSSAKTNFWTEE